MGKDNWRTTSAGVQMPWIIYGTAWKKERTADLVERAILQGFRGIDTACQPRHYNEPLVGEALQRLQGHGIERESLYLQTKFTSIGGQDPNSIPYDKGESVAKQVEQSFEVSLRNLQTSYLDALILHSPMTTHGQTMEAWRAMEGIYKSGGVRQLGISNCYNLNTFKELYADAVIKPAVLQNRFYQDTEYDVLLRSWCDQYSIIYQSFWTLTANPDKLNTDVIHTIAKRHQRTVQQVFFRFLSQTGIVPLTGTCSEQHMKEDLAIFEFTLSVEEVELLKMLLGLD